MTETRTLPPRKPSVAALLSLFGTGVGHLYAGRARRGLILFALTLVFVPLCFVVASLPPSQLGGWFVVGSAALIVLVYVGSIFDAMFCARRAARPYTSRPCNQVGLYVLLAVVATGWAIGGTLLVRALALEAYEVPTRSMEPTIGSGNRVLVNKLDREVERGDIVVFRYPLDPRRHFIKRIVGLPGDRMEVRDGQLHRNDQPLGGRASKPFDAVVVPEGHVYVLGDNPASSMDSRKFGPVPAGTIVGVAQYLFRSVVPRLLE